MEKPYKHRFELDGVPLELMRAKMASVKFLKKLAAKEGVSFTNNENCTWFIVTKGFEIIACCSLMHVSDEICRFKSDFVRKDWRGKGLYDIMFKQRDEYAEEKGYVRATAFSSQDSRSTFLRHGFTMVGKHKDDDPQDGQVIYMERYVKAT